MLKYLFIIVIVTSACTGSSEVNRFDAKNIMCVDEVLPALCTVLVGCGHHENMQVCNMQVRPICNTKPITSSLADIVDCTIKLKTMSCEDSVPHECLELR